MLIPWQGICSTHLFNPEHHQHSEGPSTCDLRKSYTGDEDVIWPPMDCENQEMIIDSFERPVNENLSISAETVYLTALVLNAVYLPGHVRPVPDIEIAGHNLAPPISINPLRGPPFIISFTKVSFEFHN